jgi:hypothetical protein
VHWIPGLNIFACTLTVHVYLTLLNPPLRAINLEKDAVEKLNNKSLLTRTLEGTKDADTVQKKFRNISSLCDVSGELFSSRTKMFVYIDRLAKIDTQLHTEEKVEEIFKVISQKHE